MSTTGWKTFVHPHQAYRLEYPAHWENLVQDDGRSCGFGPKERDNVGLWISIMPVSLDTERLAADLPQLFQQAFTKGEAGDIRRDSTLRHHGLKADITTEGQAGYYWIVAGGDLVLFASSQVPAAERDEWNPQFDRLMASLRITREDALMMRKVANDLLARLREQHPEQDYEFDEKGGVRGRDHRLSLENLYREIRESPDRRDQIVRHFAEAVAPAAHAPMGYEEWDEISDRILPVLKPKAYIKPDTATQHLLITPWLADVVICYAIRADKTFRFITGWDCRRWEIDAERVHQTAMDNLSRTEWPRRMDGARQPEGGRLILVCTTDSFSASRLLHPELHRLFHGPLGNTFLAGIPDRDTLVLFSNKTTLRKRTTKTIKKDHDKSAYPITPRLFLVTADGIALAPRD